MDYASLSLAALLSKEALIMMLLGAATAGTLAFFAGVVVHGTRLSSTTEKGALQKQGAIVKGLLIMCTFMPIVVLMLYMIGFRFRPFDTMMILQFMLGIVAIGTILSVVGWLGKKLSTNPIYRMLLQIGMLMMMGAVGYIAKEAMN